jgi:glycine/D-amino acid oxidase-like deaminating enzyme
MTANYERLSLWLEQAGPLDPRPALDGDIDADVAIIGAGFTGLWTAYYLLSQQPSLRVVLLERAVAGSGASGRNGGFCDGYLNGDPDRYAGEHGREATLALRQAAARTPEVIQGVLQAEAIDAGFVTSGSINLARTPGQVQRQQERIAAHPEWKLGNGLDKRWLSADEVAQHVNVPGVLGAIFSPAVARVQPARLVRGLAQAVERRGATIYEQTTVTAIDDRRVRTDRGTVRAQHVIRATEGYSEGLNRNNRRLLAFTSQIVATEPLPETVWDKIGLANRELLVNNDRLFIYMQRTVDDRIALGGGYTYRPVRPTEQAAESRFLVASNFALLEQTVRTMFPDAADARITHRWGGIWGAGRDFCPTVSYDRLSGFGWAGGYGDGVAASNLAGRCLADLILGQDTELSRLAWVNHAARSWPPNPLPRMGSAIITHGFGLADKREHAGRPTPPWIKVLEAMVPK